MSRIDIDFNSYKHQVGLSGVHLQRKRTMKGEWDGAEQSSIMEEEYTDGYHQNVVLGHLYFGPLPCVLLVPNKNLQWVCLAGNFSHTQKKEKRKCFFIFLLLRW